MTEPRGGQASTYLTAEEWEAMEKYLKAHPGETRHSVLKAGLRMKLKLDDDGGGE